MSIQLRLRRSASRLWSRRRADQGPARQIQHLPFRRSVTERAFTDRLLPAGFVPGLLPAGLLAAADVVVVDVETTGWFADSAGITEIGAVRLTSGRPAVEFSALVNPQMPIPPEITTLTGITDAMVRDQPAIGQVLPRFLEFAKGSMIAAHNAPFDLGFLTAACAANDLTWPPCAVIDTAVLARLVLPAGEVADHKLTTLAAHFGTGTGPSHRALADAKATAGVLAGLLSRVQLASRVEPAGHLASQRRRAGLRSARGRLAATIAPQPGYGLPESTPGTRRGGMVTAIVLIKCDVARIPETAEAIAQITEVSEVYSVTGEFDLVAMVRVREHEELGNVIPGQVNRVAGVTHTETHIAFRAYSRHDLDAAFSIGYPESS